MGVIKIYIFIYCIACFGAIILASLNRRNLGLFQKGYWKFLLKPWRTITFLIALTGITVAAPYSGDPTWDYFDSIVISILVYTTSPWTTGTFYLGFKKKTSWQHLYIAICTILFSSSWFYDLYIFIRDGIYPQTWFSNMLISTSIYISAGLFWNLEWDKEKGVCFAFQREGWYLRKYQSSFKRILWITIPFILFALYAVLWFVWTDMKWIIIDALK